MKNLGSWEVMGVARNSPVSKWLSLGKKPSLWIPGEPAVIAVASSFSKYSAEES